VAQTMRNKLERRYGQRQLHFITCTCYRRRPLLGTGRKRDAFLRILKEVRERHQFWQVGYAGLRLPIAWKPRWLREWSDMPYVVACLQAVIAQRAAEQLEWNGRLGNQIENPV
jgi:hypothetical protein